MKPILFVCQRCGEWGTPPLSEAWADLKKSVADLGKIAQQAAQGKTPQPIEPITPRMVCEDCHQEMYQMQPGDRLFVRPAIVEAESRKEIEGKS